MNRIKKIMPKTNLLSRKRVKILDVYVDSSSTSSLLTAIGQKLASRHKFYIVTPNPEIVLEACKDKLLAKIINDADFSIPDGVGLKLADPNLNIIHGRKMMEELIKLSKQKKWKTFFLGFKNGPMLDKNGEPATDLDSKVNKDIVKQINKLKPDIVFVGFGAPKQEKWIWKNKDKLNVKCLMAVGGAIDYYSGVKKLPPKWMQSLELEWLFRLFVEPWRLPRIFKAVIIFPLKVFVNKYFA
ncbi:MAG: WecB/TagA/CpsF family glycosyltransferase [Patescibacteria group bacterium]